MQIQVNGKSRETRAQTVAQLLEELGFSTPENAPVGMAVAVNENVVRRASHREFSLNDGDEIEIIRAVQGG
ncbi:sulfur carrier protein [Abditibacterium utsteinense]|uniref:Sulfur carrier protein n=1 Tax=Abditibacterium utsteinense TaxID=1960156 RepID=A0A2S8SX91_9BACT|nr:sulfur carrier protein ThiS [Abditibacterium utsteinense]PQV65415.1 sulfur carrier protein [Abditibacterium utsteinense]